ncbi:MAG: diguanylate cyclase [Chloroflexi bacterium]|nr:MAG: diguanylate cyclase [Chloroflexota bacterium]
MIEPVVRVLLIEDNPGDARIIKEALAESTATRFQIEVVQTLADGLVRLAEQDVDAALIDLSLPDSVGLETFHRARAGAEGIPIIVLTGLDDDTVASAAVNAGAQDFISKNRVQPDSLARAIRYAIERERMLQQVRQMAVLDALTGLNNRRGFVLVCQHLCQLANRNGRRLGLLFLDLDGLKQINDGYGHGEGDRALVDMAKILERTFRKADVLGRLGGDEFVVLLAEGSTDGAGRALDRLRANVDAFNQEAARRYRLSVSVGLSWYDPATPAPVDALIEQADRAMYVEKLAKKKAA